MESNGIFTLEKTVVYWRLTSQMSWSIGHPAAVQCQCVVSNSINRSVQCTWGGKWSRTYPPQANFLLKLLLSIKYNIDIELKWGKKKRKKHSVGTNNTENSAVMCNHSPWCCLHPRSWTLGWSSWRRWRWWPESRSGASRTDRAPLSLPANRWAMCVNLPRAIIRRTTVDGAGDTAEAPSRPALPTYRILLLPQVRPLGAAHLREEGVEVGRFPLAAAPVFHPADAGKTLSRREFGNHCTPLHKERQTGRPAGGNTRILLQTSLLGRRSIYHTEVVGVFFFFNKSREKCDTNPSWKIGTPAWYVHTSESLAGPSKVWRHLKRSVVKDIAADYFFMK